MTAKIISGTETAKAIREELKVEVDELREKHNVTPGLVTILVGEDPASKIYVRMKEAACEEVGFLSREYKLPADVDEGKILSIISDLNRDEEIHGILVQLPLPGHISSDPIIEAIDPQKDAVIYRRDYHDRRLYRFRAV